MGVESVSEVVRGNCFKMGVRSYDVVVRGNVSRWVLNLTLRS